MSVSCHYLHEPTKFGVVGIIWHEPEGKIRIIRIFFAENKESAEKMVHNNYLNAFPSSNTLILEHTRKIQKFLSGKQVEFYLDILAFEMCSSFQRCVLLAEKDIPWGMVSTYDRIGKFIGFYRAARAVGHALATNPFPIIIPCHRAIRSDLALGGYQGGMDMKRTLLEFEGVKISEKGKVMTPRYYY